MLQRISATGSLERVVEQAIAAGPEDLDPALVLECNRVFTDVFESSSHADLSLVLSLGDFVVEHLTNVEAAGGRDTAFALKLLERAWADMLQVAATLGRVLGRTGWARLRLLIPFARAASNEAGQLGGDAEALAVPAAWLHLLVASELALRGDPRLRVWALSASRAARQVRASFDSDGLAGLRMVLAHVEARTAHVDWDETDLAEELATWPEERLAE